MSTVNTATKTLFSTPQTISKKEGIPSTRKASRANRASVGLGFTAKATPPSIPQDPQKMMNKAKDSAEISNKNLNPGKINHQTVKNPTKNGTTKKVEQTGERVFPKAPPIVKFGGVDSKATPNHANVDPRVKTLIDATNRPTPHVTKPTGDTSTTTGSTTVKTTNENPLNNLLDLMSKLKSSDKIGINEDGKLQITDSSVKDTSKEAMKMILKEIRTQSKQETFIDHHGTKVPISTILDNLKNSKWGEATLDKSEKLGNKFDKLLTRVKTDAIVDIQTEKLAKRGKQIAISRKEIEKAVKLIPDFRAAGQNAGTDVFLSRGNIEFLYIEKTNHVILYLDKIAGGYYKTVSLAVDYDDGSVYAGSKSCVATKEEWKILSPTDLSVTDAYRSADMAANKEVRKIPHVLSSLHMMETENIDGGLDIIELMSYQEGELFDSIDKMDDSQKNKVTEHILTALSGLHKIGIVHNDISSSNILLDNSGDAVLMDFGKAENLLNLKGTNAKEVRKSIDIKQLGVVLYLLHIGCKDSNDQDLPEPDKADVDNKVSIQEGKILSMIKKGKFPKPEDPKSIQHLIWSMVNSSSETPFTADQALAQFKKINSTKANTDGSTKKGTTNIDGS